MIYERWFCDQSSEGENNMPIGKDTVRSANGNHKILDLEISDKLNFTIIFKVFFFNSTEIFWSKYRKFRSSTDKNLKYINTDV